MPVTGLACEPETDAPRSSHSSHRPRSILRFAADRRTLVFIASYYVLAVAEWRLAPLRWGIVVPLVALTCVVSWIAAVITHNTLHSPVFTKRWMNRAFQVVLSCSYGFPVSEYTPGHNLSHHRFTQGRADVMRTSKVNFKLNFLNGLMFMPSVAPGVTVANYRYASAVGGRALAWRRQLLIEAIFVWGSKLLLLFVDWRRALLFIFIPHLFAVWGITSVNFVQHDGCDENSEFNHSRNFVGRLFNWFTFNNGYHTMHHITPGLHWSLLAEAHTEKVHPFIHPALEQKSLAVYLFKTFVRPGKRVRYDGSPIVLPEEGPDEEWIPRESLVQESFV